MQGDWHLGLCFVAWSTPPCGLMTLGQVWLRSVGIVQWSLRCRAIMAEPSGSLDAHDHRVRPRERLGIAVAESDISQPAAAIGRRIVEARVGFDEHVQAHEQAESISSALVVDDRVVDDKRAAV